MKTKLALLILAMTVLLAACGGGGNSASEKASLEYVNVFLNGTDQEKKEKFVEDYVHADIAPLFQMLMAADNGDSQGDEYKNAKVAESTTFKEDGDTVEAVLIQADGDKEVIVLLMEGKIAFAFPKTGENDEAFNSARSNFKTK